MRILPDKPECIHDGDRYGEKDDIGSTRMWCSLCDALLTQNHVVMDDTYGLLYTRKGRLGIVRRALAAAGWDVPAFWEQEESGE